MMSGTFLNRLLQRLYQRVIMIMIILFSLGLGVAFVGTYYLSIYWVDSQAVQYSSVVIQTLNQARRFYSEDVVDRLESIKGVQVIPEYHAVSGGIPNPATFTIELGELLSNQSTGTIFRLYSNFPFPHRQATGGPQDQFERAALNYLQKHPQAAYYRKERVGDRLSFRYTEAVLMEPSCVACHNTLPSSPKKDWKVGQVRGIAEITQPLEQGIQTAQGGLKTIYLALTTIITLAMMGLGLAVGRFRTLNQELEKKVAERTAALERLATVDELTQLANRRQFDQRLEQAWKVARRQQHPLSLILCDVDYFKNYNDTYGHPAGDECLRSIAKVLDRSIRRPGEFSARYGGEEFAIVLPNVSRMDAIQIVTTIQTAIHQLQIPHRSSLNHASVTLSLGIATMIPNANYSPEQLIQAADEALYQAKHQGRDRYVVWDNP
ncbi:diguanylate cyclase domain-containing protein [Acaryochloris marina]|uniref:diguanylate cyclase domain-containing protein n=1 Tax=Acaryochloris marina TaxID=155978 RepID=UPI0021C2BE27|nr:diguanylate cyclase [Acaryochloris marina]BDM77489.1 hypothetical protein AM10699_03630 [Acaryochloris marina MBIC10699]